MSEAAPIVIIGGGVIGCATAYFLKLQQPQCAVVVVERDPSYQCASSALSVSSIRQQFSTAINIQISAFGIAFLRQAHVHLNAPTPAAIGLHEGGYLYLATHAGAAALCSNHALQRSLGADVALLSAAELQERYPWLHTADVALGSLGLSGEGWFDGYALLRALRQQARSMGVQFVHDAAIGLVLARHEGVQHVQAVTLQRAGNLPCTAAVNAGGPWAAAIAAWAQIALPVAGKCRTVFQACCPHTLPDCPLLIEPSGIWLRPDGPRGKDASFLIGFAPDPGRDADFAPLEPDWSAFESHVWPLLAHRIPAFAALRLQSAWAGYYEMNRFDHNAIVGLHPDCDNLWFANGFSGHGLQQCPAIGRGLAEHILTGRWQSLDLEPLGWRRVLHDQPLLEKNII